MKLLITARGSTFWALRKSICAYLLPVIPTSNLRVKETVRLLPPSAIKAAVPMTDSTNATVVAGPEEVLLRPDAKEIIPPLYLQDGCRIAAGQRLTLRAEDKETGQDLGAVELTMLLDWE